MSRLLLLCLLLSPLASAQTFDELSSRAQAALDADPKTAAALFHQALALRPEWPEGWLYLGASLYAQQQYEDASSALEKGVALAPKNGPGWGLLGLCEFNLHDEAAAMRDMEKGQRLGLGDNHAFESAVRQTAALVLIRASRFDDALGELQPLVKFGIDTPGVVTEAGLCALAIAKSPEQLTPAQAPVVTLAGKAQWAVTSLHPDQAKTAFEQLLLQYPTERGVHYAYALFLIEKDETAALQEFEKETAAHPDFWPAWLVISNLETKAGAPDKALEAVQHAQPLAPAADQWLCAADAGSAYLTMGKADRAIEEFRLALRDRPSYPQLHYYLSRALFRNKETAEAQRENEEFKRLNAAQNPQAIAPVP